MLFSLFACKEYILFLVYEWMTMPWGECSVHVRGWNSQKFPSPLTLPCSIKEYGLRISASSTFLHQKNECQMFFARQDTTIRIWKKKKIFCVKFRFHSEQLGMPFSSAVSNNFVFFALKKGKIPQRCWRTEKNLYTCWCTTWLDRFFS